MLCRARLCATLLLAVCACAQTPPFTIEQVMSAAFPSQLTAAPTGGKVAWVSNAQGVRNILVAEPPRYLGLTVTAYTSDDGQELSNLRFTPDGTAIVYVRGGEPNSAGESPNPALDPRGASQAVWIVGLDGSAPRRTGDGSAPAVSPKGDLIAYLRRGRIWLARVDGSTAPAQAFAAMGDCGNPIWSPDGARIAFVSSRGDHSFIGVYEVASSTLRYLDPSTNFDSNPEWSPDSRSIVFTRLPSTGLRPVREARRAGPPWSIRIADAISGTGREIFRASEGRGSVFREMVASSQLFWCAGDRIVFPWELDGWLHLYSVPAAGGKVTPLTPGEFEVEDAAPAADRRAIFYSSNQNDIDRRHIVRVPLAGGLPTRFTSGRGVESRVTPTSSGDTFAFLRSDARVPLRAAIFAAGDTHDMDPGAIPAEFPAAQMVAPEQVILLAADGPEIHGQLFLPRRAAGRAPAVVFFHGGPQRQMLLAWHNRGYYSNAYAFNQFLVNRGYVVLSINFRSGVGYGMNFREALNFGASGASDFNDVRAAGEYLRSRPEVDPSRIGAWGGSYGGFLTAMALARDPSVFRAGVDLHGVHNWATELRIPPTEPDYRMAFNSSPMAFLDNWRSPVLLIQGDDDRDVQFNQTVMLAAALRARKVDVEELIFPNRDPRLPFASLLDRGLHGCRAIPGSQTPLESGLIGTGVRSTARKWSSRFGCFDPLPS